MLTTTSVCAERRQYACLLQVVQPGRHNRLLPKIYVNVGITQEADGRLHAACDNYRCILPASLARLNMYSSRKACMSIPNTPIPGKRQQWSGPSSDRQAGAVPVSMHIIRQVS